MKNKLKTNLILAGALFLALSSCTKTIPFEAANPDQKVGNYSKSLISQDEEYIFASAQQQSSMSSVDAFPYYASDNKRVKLKITEKALQIIEIERDQRYASNPHNDKLVLEIPIIHTQFECAKDKFGECTNTEADNTKVPWNQKPNITTKFEDLKPGQLEFLPLVENKTYGDNSYTELGAELVSSSVEKDAINFKIRRHFKASINTVDGNTTGELETASAISADYQFSLVKASSVLSRDYKTISYPIGSKDEQTFGFFSTSKTKLDVDGNTSDKTRIQIMNRWNPNREEITYYLSDEFAKPENKMVNDLTVKTVNNLNDGLKEAGVKFRINLKQPEGKNPGDIRNSMIVLVEDPIASSVIGYGPQTEDPVTGEIISARTIMYLGSIKAYAKYTYDNIIRAKKEAKAEAISQPADNKKSLPLLTMSSGFLAKMNNKVKTGKTFGVNAAIEKYNKAKETKTQESSKKQVVAKSNTAGSSGMVIPTNFSEKLKIINKDLKNYTKVKNTTYIPDISIPGDSLNKKFKYMNEVKNCAFRGNAMEGISSGISQKLMDKIPDDAKPWTELSDSEKQAIIEIILPEVWIPTLIHEMGHNLGLRHNFQGSEDKENFYSNDELIARQIDHAIPFSSIMEYGDDLKALPVLGKYDIAALRFGYNREVDIVNKSGAVSTVKVESTLGDIQLNDGLDFKAYGYCTDEHVGINAGCKRFDLGTSYTEIAQNMIKDYEDAYSKRNFRNGRESMSLYDDLSYARRVGGIFEDLRTMLEVKERIKYKYQLPDNAPEWEQVAFLKDLNEAATISGQQLAKVIATPDVLCAVSAKSKPNQVVAVINMKEYAPEGMSCADVRLNQAYMVVGQAGKLFNSMKDPESKNSYADQIDIRGYWIDKVQATKALLKRQTPFMFNYPYERPTPTFDKNNDSFLNQAGVGNQILSLVEAIMQDNVVDNVEFTLINGTKASLQIPYELSKSQVIDKHIYGPIARIIGINENSPTKLQQMLSEMLVDEAKDLTGANPADESLAYKLSVHRYLLPATPGNIAEALQLQIGAQDLYFASKDNTVAHDMIENFVVADKLEQIKTEDDKVDMEKINEILQAKLQNGKPAGDASEAEKAVWELAPEKIDAFLNNVIKPSLYYTDMIRILPAYTHK